MLEETGHDQSAWRSRVTYVFLAFAVIAAFFLVGEHRAHVLLWLPWLFLAACPLMHVFMHHGHSGHDHGDRRGSDGHPSAAPDEVNTASSGRRSIDSGSASHHHHADRS